jgi:hypothetical protein
MQGAKYLSLWPVLVAALIVGSILGTGNLLFAATLCVNPGGTGGLFFNDQCSRGRGIAE